MMKYLVSLVMVMMLFATTAMATDVVLVVNKANPVASLSDKIAKKIFLGKKGSWDSGDKIMLYSQYDAQITDSFARKVLNKSAQQFATFWKKALFTGTGRPPIEVKDDAEMLKFIAADPRGIGYISRSAVDGSVKVIKLQ